jgi:hypothetical protein
MKIKKSSYNNRKVKKQSLISTITIVEGQQEEAKVEVKVLRRGGHWEWLGEKQVKGY